MPLGLRLLLVALLGIVAGRVASWFSWWLVRIQQPIERPPEHARLSPAHGRPGLSAWIPLVGAWRLRRLDPSRAAPTGLRPLAVEIGLALGLAALYWWEIERWGLVRDLAPPAFVPNPADLTVLHAQFAAHAVLVWWMLVASLVDFDEQTIPDLITVPGTLLGLLFAAVWPWSLLPVVKVANGAANVGFLTLASPGDWPARWGAKPGAEMLAVALACFLLWCAALLPWRWHRRRGWLWGLRIILARLSRDSVTRLVGVIALCGSAGIVVAGLLGGDHWQGLLSALVGLAAGGALMWSTRIAAGWAMGREAMGFGDVTLLAMIGSFLGWQAGPLVFFLAPLAGVVLGLAQWFAYRENVLPFGPFLCLAALVVVVAWGPLWNWAAPLYALPWLVPAALVVSLVGMAVLLRLWRGLRDRLLPAE